LKPISEKKGEEGHTRGEFGNDGKKTPGITRGGEKRRERKKQWSEIPIPILASYEVGTFLEKWEGIRSEHCLCSPRFGGCWGGGGERERGKGGKGGGNEVGRGILRF